MLHVLIIPYRENFVKDIHIFLNLKHKLYTMKAVKVDNFLLIWYNFNYYAGIESIMGSCEEYFRSSSSEAGQRTCRMI